jgi:glucan phosphoethanolaminetransferase (alkaline phosphatase superfamily)
MEKPKLWKQEIKFHLGLNVLIAVFITIASYAHYPYGNLKAFFIYCFHFLLLQFSIFGFVYLLSLFKKFFQILFPILFIILVSLSFWVYTQDITISTGMIQVILEANVDIALDVLSLESIIYLIISLSCLLFFMKKFRKVKVSSIKSPLFIVSILAVSTFFLVENYKYGAFKRRLPYNVYFGLLEYAKKPNLKLKEVEGNIVSNEKNLQIIFVLGESVRADHLSLNGYNRNTTPLLSNQKNVVSFNKVYTPLTYTAISVPQILTSKSINDKDSEDEISLFSVLRKANFDTEWIGNQSLEKSYKDIVHSNESVTIIDKFHSVLSFKKERDLSLLKYFSIDNSLTKNKISTIHMIGSHWYYNSRFDSDLEYFKPITSSKYIGSSSAEEIINSYDNTILYLDYFLNNLIEKLKKSSKKTILIYLSDHGEILGEDGRWMHAQDHNASKNPAMLVWFSTNFEKRYPLRISNLKAKKKDSITTDFLFHSILDIAKIENFKYIKSQSIFN